jgi:hypothetical protein
MERRSAMAERGSRARRRPRLARPRGGSSSQSFSAFCPARWMDEGVDRLGGDGAQPAFLAALEPAGDPLRRPTLQQPLADEPAESGVALEDGRPLPALEVATLGVHRQVAALGQRIPM